MLGYRGLANLEFLHQCPYGLVTAAQRAQDFPPGSLCYDSENIVYDHIHYLSGRSELPGLTRQGGRP